MSLALHTTILSAQQVATGAESSETARVTTARVTEEILQRSVTVRVDREPLKRAITKVAESGGVQVSYDLDLVDAYTAPVTVRAKNTPLGVVFAQILAGTGLHVVGVPGGRLAIVDGPAPRLQLFPAQQGKGIIAGRVTDSAKTQGVEGVTISVQGTKLKTITLNGGGYVIRDAPTGTYRVTARLIGFVPAAATVTVREGETVMVPFVLRRMTNVLSEVVTTATGERQRLEVGNSVARLNVDSLRAIAPITSVTDLLDGHVPGLVVTRGSGAPGAPSRVRVRGIGSIAATNDPIIIVNGVRVYSNQTTSERDAQFSVLDRIDPSTIQTIEVLRGPSASALYGSDASAGVIVITTRRGESGKTRWTFATDQQRTTQPQNFPDQYYREGLRGIATEFQPCRLGFPGCTSTRVTVYNPLAKSRTTVLGAGYRQSYSASVSGGSPTIQYALTGNTDSDLGVLKMSDADVAFLEQQTLQSVPRWQRRPQSSSTSGGNARFTLQPMPALAVDLTSTINRSTRSTTPLADALSIYQSGTLPADTSLVTFRIPDFRRRTLNRDLSLLNSVRAKWTPASFFSLAGDAGLQNISQQSDALLRRGDYDCRTAPCSDSAVNGNLDQIRGRRSVGTVNLNGTVRVPSRFGAQLTPVIGLNYIHETINDVTVKATNLPLGGTTSNGAGNISVIETGSTPVQIGLFLSTGVSLFNERLFTTFGTRIDASNSLGKQVQPTYPKLDLSYLLSRESFFPSRLGSLRLRLAYGHAAVQPEAGATFRSYGSGFNVENGEIVPVQYLATLGNTQLRPERSTELESGFDWGVFEERVHLTFTGFRKLSRDALVTSIPPSSVGGGGGAAINLGGVSVFTSNIGSVRNTGVEMSADAVVIDRAAFRWSVNGSLSHFRNTLVTLSPQANRTLDPGSFSFTNPNGPIGIIYGTRYVEGYPLAGLWMRRPVRYADTNGDGAITNSEIVYADSATFVGGPLPNYDATFGTQLGLWNGHVLVATQFQYQNGMSQANEATLANLRSGGTGSVRALNDPSTSLADQAEYLSGYATLRTVSTLRLQSLSVRVTAPGRFVRMLRAGAASIALQGNNLGLWTTYSGADPNVTGSIVGNTVSDPGVLPMPRTWGLNVSLNY